METGLTLDVLGPGALGGFKGVRTLLALLQGAREDWVSSAKGEGDVSDCPSTPCIKPQPIPESKLSPFFLDGSPRKGGDSFGSCDPWTPSVPERYISSKVEQHWVACFYPLSTSGLSKCRSTLL